MSAAERQAWNCGLSFMIIERGAGTIVGIGYPGVGFARGLAFARIVGAVLATFCPSLKMVRELSGFNVGIGSLDCESRGISVYWPWGGVVGELAVKEGNS